MGMAVTTKVKTTMETKMHKLTAKLEGVTPRPPLGRGSVGERETE